MRFRLSTHRRAWLARTLALALLAGLALYGSGRLLPNASAADAPPDTNASASAPFALPPPISPSDCAARPESRSASGWLRDPYSYCQVTDDSVLLVDPRENPPIGEPFGRIDYTLTAIAIGSNTTREVTVKLYVDITQVLTYPDPVSDPWSVNVTVSVPCTGSPTAQGCESITPGTTLSVREWKATPSPSPVSFTLRSTAGVTSGPGAAEQLATGVFQPNLKMSSDALNEYSKDGVKAGIRFDSAAYMGNNIGKGAIFGTVDAGGTVTVPKPKLTYDLSPTSDVAEVAQHIYAAQHGIGTIYPAYPGLTKTIPTTLHRLTDAAKVNKNRNGISVPLCRAIWGKNYATGYGLTSYGHTRECDEYPFASTYEGGTGAGTPRGLNLSVCPLDADHNGNGGTELGTFYAFNRVLDDEAFDVSVPLPAGQSPPTGPPCPTPPASPYPTRYYGPGSPVGFSVTGTWSPGTGTGIAGLEIWTASAGSIADASAAWTGSLLDATTAWKVEAYIPNNHNTTASAHYHLAGAATADTTVNQSTHPAAWVTLGSVCASDGGEITVSLDNATGEPPGSKQVVADAVRFTPTGLGCGPSTPPASYPAGTIGPGSPSSQFHTTSVWFDGGGTGLIGKEIWTYSNGSTADSTATWDADGLDVTRLYRVEAYVPDDHSNTTHAHYHLVGQSAQDTYVDQSKLTNVWAPLGSDCPAADGTITVTLDDATGEAVGAKQVGADAVRFTKTTIVCEPVATTTTVAPTTTSAPTGYPAGTYGPGAGCCFATHSTWFPGKKPDGSPVGLIGKEIWTYSNGSTADSTATWSQSFDTRVYWRVEAWIPDWNSNTTHAHYHITGATAADAYVNQQSYTNAWVGLTTICPASNGNITVRLDDATGEAVGAKQVGADAMRFTRTTIAC